ncbi:MAG TPA: hypothetical protein VFY68_01710, partial [Nitrososphaeraceae archaeon]|nr:hypothetical protein [Nitrososphaeraceae archaeon]
FTFMYVFSEKDMRVNKQAKEAQLQHIFRMLLESYTYEEIARELNIGIKTVYNYALELDKRYGQIQAQKTNNTIFTECQLFKNRMLKLYKILEDKAQDPKISGTDTAKCVEVAANIAIDVLKADVEGIKAVKELVGYGNKEQSKLVESIQHRYRSSDNNNNSEQDNNISNDNTVNEQDSNFKF